MVIRTSPAPVRGPPADSMSALAAGATARQGLAEALELFFEEASPEEITSRSAGEVYVTTVDVAVA